ncbi:hypothetical protein WSI_01280 [Candidatus Liberibacter asiaticus str. gxpsy]|uniref:Uncharacterized protein n=2 Tax=Liberibacter asiaticus TaxID=34021 RepID=C6XHW9_LIBAP|nr:hypothetical protein CLIBASIA_01370 [Candidatus Liberibacter asiaticus str. psy62]AGH16626.1 hypothetical protein WSI_01280 [Candidatus Liberibacter asiaticus str. gxpsy]BAP26147.1 hypothetical protein CGUJ_01370 [Candidatus Liberibacter asiaticus str. Ishi-1]
MMHPFIFDGMGNIRFLKFNGEGGYSKYYRNFIISCRTYRVFTAIF